jgi:pimeloyl-ACP methyl ester carboxylesterase
MARRTLLACGVLSSLLYAGMNVFVAMQWDDYSSASQTVSELSAIGAPTRAIWVPLGTLYTLLVAAFGWGVWQSASRSRPLRVAGAMLIAYGIVGLGWPPMHQRAVLAAGGGTLTDTLHLTWAAVTVFLMLLAMGFGAAAFGTRFRAYTVASLATLMTFGALTGMDAPAVQADLPTPWVGVWERINIGVFLVWVVALAVALWRVPNAAKVTMSNSSAFKTPEGEAAYLAAYGAAMKAWPVPYEEEDIPSRFGITHVVVSGPKEAPPLVLLHGYWATLTMWTPNVAELSKDYRVYAIDVMGQPGKSIPDEPIRDAADYAAWLTAILDGLRLDRISLVGMSYGGWLALNYAIATPNRVRKLVLLSPAACLLPLVRQFSVRGMLMVFVPARLTVNSFMRWMGFTGDPAGLMYLGLKHFRIPKETLRVAPAVFADDQLRSMHVPTLILIGEREVIYDAAAALDRARRRLPNCEGRLVLASSHDMTFSQHRIVDARILDFLGDNRRIAPERVVA